MHPLRLPSGGNSRLNVSVIISTLGLAVVSHSSGYHCLREGSPILAGPGGGGWLRPIPLQPSAKKLHMRCRSGAYPPSPLRRHAESQGNNGQTGAHACLHKAVPIRGNLKKDDPTMSVGESLHCARTARFF